MAIPSYYLGIDIGGTKVALRAETDTGCAGEVVFPWAVRHGAVNTGSADASGGGAKADLAELAVHVDELLARIGTRPTTVGVAMPGTVGPTGVVTAWPSRPQWTGLDLDAALRTLFPGAAVAWADDGDLGALAEAQAAGCDDLLYVGVGTGIGGGLVLGGRLCPGLGRGSFELGHLLVKMDGARCSCGRRGCLQAIASGTATLRRATLLRGAEVTFDDLRHGLRDRRTWAVTALGQTCRALAAAVAGVRELFHPRQVLIGGGFAAGLPDLAGLVADHLAELNRPGLPPLPVEPAALGGLSSLRGAVSLARMIAADMSAGTASEPAASGKV